MNLLTVRKYLLMKSLVQQTATQALKRWQRLDLHLFSKLVINYTTPDKKNSLVAI